MSVHFSSPLGINSGSNEPDFSSIGMNCHSLRVCGVNRAVSVLSCKNLDNLVNTMHFKQYALVIIRVFCPYMYKWWACSTEIKMKFSQTQTFKFHWVFKFMNEFQVSSQYLSPIDFITFLLKYLTPSKGYYTLIKISPMSNEYPLI